MGAGNMTGVSSENSMPRYLRLNDAVNRLARSIEQLDSTVDSFFGKEKPLEPKNESDQKVRQQPYFVEVYNITEDRLHVLGEKVEIIQNKIRELLI